MKAQPRQVTHSENIEMYSDMFQPKNETVDQLDTHIKSLLKKCQHSAEEMKTHHVTVSFHYFRHFKI